MCGDGGDPGEAPRAEDGGNGRFGRGCRARCIRPVGPLDLPGLRRPEYRPLLRVLRHAAPVSARKQTGFHNFL